MKLRKLGFIGLFVFLLCLVCCSEKASRISDETARNLIEQMPFGKNHKSGLCFGVVGYENFLEIDKNDGIILVGVDCENVEHLLINKPEKD